MFLFKTPKRKKKNEREESGNRGGSFRLLFTRIKFCKFVAKLGGSFQDSSAQVRGKAVSAALIVRLRKFELVLKMLSLFGFFFSFSGSGLGAPGGRALRSGQGQAVLRARSTERRATSGREKTGGEAALASSWVGSARPPQLQPAG